MSRPSEPVSLQLLSIGEVPPELMTQMAVDLGRRFPIPVTVLDRIALDSSTYDERRRQMAAETALATIRKRYAALLGRPETRIIAITSDDMYTTSEDWAFTFSLRDKGNQLALVSYHRMRPEMFGNAPDEVLLQSRLRKMVIKDVGIMCYGFPTSESPRSVLYASIGGTDELDLMTEEFDPVN